MFNKFIAYEGKIFTIEWYFDIRGKSQSLDYFNELSIDRKKKILKLFELIGDFGKIFNTEKFRNEGDQIYAFKPSTDRFLCFFFEDSKIIVTNAFEKKTNKLSKNEKDKSLKLKEEYKVRFKKGYYA